MLKSWQSEEPAFLEQARGRIFARVLLLGSAALAVAGAVAALRGNWVLVSVEALVIAFLLALLGLGKAGRLDWALGLFGGLIPMVLAGRYFSVAASVGPSGYSSDYLLGYGLLSLIALALVSTRVRRLAVVWALYAGAGAYNLYTIQESGRQIDDLLVRYYLLLTLAALNLGSLQSMIRLAARSAAEGEQRLETLVADRTKSLQETQERLDRARAVLAAGEKANSLGRLVAGIAHEMNTPLAAIQASGHHLTGRIRIILDQWSRLGPSLPPGLLALVVDLMLNAETNVSHLDPRQARERRARFTSWLTAQGLAEPEGLARRLAEMGIEELRPEWLPLLRSPRAAELLDRAEELVDYERSVSIIGVAAQKASAHVLSLRRFADGPQADRPTVAVDLGQNVETVLLVYRSQFGPGLKVVTHLPATGPWVMGQADRLMQVWNNLTSNAAQALGDRGTLTIEAGTEGAEAVVRVIDDGPGIPDAIQPRILDPFFTTKATGEGMGLGLEIVRTIVEDHRGRLRFESRPGRTVFEVRLPASSAP